MRYENFHIETPEKLKLHVSLSKSTPLNSILFHGFGEGSFVWGKLRDSISSISSTVAIDFRGHGESSWDPNCSYRTSAYSSDSSLALSHFRVPNKVLVGHSLGGNVCIQLAKKMKHSLRALILIDCSPDIDPDSESYILDDFHSEHREYNSIEEYANFIRSKRPLLSQEISLMIASGALRKNKDNIYHLKRDQALGYPENWGEPDATIWDNLDTITCPVLLLRGSGSAILSKTTGEKLAAQFKNCEYKTIKLAGHAVMLDNPTDSNNAIGEFLMKIIKG